MTEIRIDRMLGRQVIAKNGRRVGRLEEIRVHRSGDRWSVSDYAIGPSGLWQRLGIGARLIVGRKPHGYLAAWDQLEISEEGPLLLNCTVDELRPL